MAAVTLLSRTCTEGGDLSSSSRAPSPSSGEPTASLASSDRIWSSWHLYRDLTAGRRTSPEPRFPEGFAWLVSVSSFRFVGRRGRFTACRVYDKGPTRAFQAHRVIHQH